MDMPWIFNYLGYFQFFTITVIPQWISLDIALCIRISPGQALRSQFVWPKDYTFNPSKDIAKQPLEKAIPTHTLTKNIQMYPFSYTDANTWLSFFSHWLYTQWKLHHGIWAALAYTSVTQSVVDGLVPVCELFVTHL